MKDKIYKQTSSLIDDTISEIYRYFSVYMYVFKRKAREIKTISHGGYERTKFVGEFNEELNRKSSELLNEVETLYVNLGRRLSPKQYTDLIDKCKKPFDLIIDDFSKEYKEEFDLNRTVENSFLLSKGRISSKISKHIKALRIMINTKMDKVLIWTATSTIFAGVSLVLSIITIMGTI